ncbi:hypothetical protein BDR26DRAFT_871722 [Obelidium mucronatum]|nr:hypothetical protein BDR26DRAFT_871722 [Obelidium mucronatum]
MESSLLPQVPVDILLAILSLVPLKCLARCTQLCRSVRSVLLSTSSIWHRHTFTVPCQMTPFLANLAEFSIRSLQIIAFKESSALDDFLMDALSVQHLTIVGTFSIDPRLLKPLFSSSLFSLNLREYSHRFVGQDHNSSDSEENDDEQAESLLDLLKNLQNLESLSLGWSIGFNLSGFLDTCPTKRIKRFSLTAVRAGNNTMLERMPLVCQSSVFPCLRRLDLVGVDITGGFRRLPTLAISKLPCLEEVYFLLWVTFQEDLNYFVETFLARVTVKGVLKRVVLEIESSRRKGLSMREDDLRLKGIIGEDCDLVFK